MAEETNIYLMELIGTKGYTTDSVTIDDSLNAYYRGTGFFTILNSSVYKVSDTTYNKNGIFTSAPENINNYYIKIKLNLNYQPLFISETRTGKKFSENTTILNFKNKITNTSVLAGYFFPPSVTSLMSEDALNLQLKRFFEDLNNLLNEKPQIYAVNIISSKISSLQTQKDKNTSEIQSLKSRLTSIVGEELTKAKENVNKLESENVILNRQITKLQLIDRTNKNELNYVIGNNTSDNADNTAMLGIFQTEFTKFVKNSYNPSEDTKKQNTANAKSKSELNSNQDIATAELDLNPSDSQLRKDAATISASNQVIVYNANGTNSFTSTDITKTNSILDIFRDENNQIVMEENITVVDNATSPVKSSDDPCNEVLSKFSKLEIMAMIDNLKNNNDYLKKQKDNAFINIKKLLKSKSLQFSSFDLPDIEINSANIDTEKLIQNLKEQAEAVGNRTIESFKDAATNVSKILDSKLSGLIGTTYSNLKGINWDKIKMDNNFSLCNTINKVKENVENPSFSDKVNTLKKSTKSDISLATNQTEKLKEYSDKIDENNELITKLQKYL
jgi:hypothetical protein